jgi:large subunit ribosomal protein L15
VFAVRPVVVNLGSLEVFAAGATVSPATLVEKNVIETYKGKIPAVKILAAGEITKKLSFEKVLVSAEAKAKIEKAGGSVVA